MKASDNWFKKNLAYGLIVLVPVAILLLLLAKVVEVLQMLAGKLELQSALGAGIAVVLALAILIVFLLIAGAVVRTRVGTWSFEKLEGILLQRLPGYEIIGNVLKGFARAKEAYPGVMVELHGPGTGVLGLLMEEHPNGVLTVFVPSAPTLTIGTVHFVTRDRVTLLQAGTVDLANCVTQWGIGSEKLVEGIDLGAPG